jgi:hypothetical protein
VEKFPFNNMMEFDIPFENSGQYLIILDTVLTPSAKHTSCIHVYFEDPFPFPPLSLVSLSVPERIYKKSDGKTWPTKRASGKFFFPLRLARNVVE